MTAIDTVGVCGAGSMGAGIAQVAAQAGHKVIVLDRDEDALARGRASVEKGAAALLKRGKLDEDEAAALKERVGWTLDVNELANANLVIEAIVENADIKQSLFEQLEATLSSDAVIATNTSSLSVTSLASKLKAPARFIGLHFFNPAPIMKLVEVVRGLDTDPALAETMLQLMERWGKVAVSVRDVPGFIVNRVARPFYSEGWRALEEGAADAATLDFLYRDLAGFRMGPFELGDLIGHDINCAAAASVFDAYFGRTRFTPSLMQGQLASSGRLGRKSGRGVYDYAEGVSKPEPSFASPSTQSDAPLRLAKDADAPIAKLLGELGVDFSIDADMDLPCAAIGEVLIDVSFGPTASTLAAKYQQPVVVLDWVCDAGSASALAFSASDETAKAAALDLAARADKKAVELSDRPGLVVFRTLAQLANCAADAVRDHVADAEAIDRAMMYGVNYPFGPMTWAADIGFEYVACSLEAIAEWTGDAIYQPSEVLRGLELKEI